MIIFIIQKLVAGTLRAAECWRAGADTVAVGLRFWVVRWEYNGLPHLDHGARRLYRSDMTRFS